MRDDPHIRKHAGETDSWLRSDCVLNKKKKKSSLSYGKTIRAHAY